LSGPQPHNGHLDIVSVVKIWAYSLAVIVVLTVVYFLLNRWKWLDDLGRTKRGKIDRRVEDFITELQRVTVVHEHHDEATGKEIYKVVGRVPPEPKE
jgi:H+-transporting ATPase